MTKATDRQVGGNHYASLAIQPMEYALKNDLNYAQANAVKYVTRYKSKGGIEDLRKAIHCIELLIQHELDEVECDKQTELTFDEERADIIGHNGNDAAVYEWEFNTEQEVVIIKDGARTDEHGNLVLVRCPDGRYIRQSNGLYRLGVSE